MLTAIGCHGYAGGFAHGVRRAGFDVIAELAPDRFGVECHRLNFPDAQQRVGAHAWKPHEFKGVDLVFANPPCAPFSTLGSGLRLADPRLKCWCEAIRVFVEAEPKVFVGESVQQMWTNGFTFLKEFSQVALATGREVHVVLHDAKFLGLAQQRRRVFVVASRFAVDFDPPDDPRVRTVREAWSGLASPGPVLKMKTEWLPIFALGYKSLHRGFRELYDEEAAKRLGIRVPRLVDHRLEWDEPCGAVVGDTMFHPEEFRRVGRSETARLMGFPDDWQWPERTHWTPLMVKGVTPNCGEYVARHAARAVSRAEPQRGTVTLWTYCAGTVRKLDFEMRRESRDITNTVEG